MTDFILVSLFCLVGFGFNVMRTILKLTKKHPKFPFKDVWYTFFQSEWPSFFISFLIWMVFMLVTFVVRYTETTVPLWWDNFGMYVVPMVIQYGGQATAYRFLNRSNDALKEKADKRNY